jgi:hypothetical protein
MSWFDPLDVPIVLPGCQLIRTLDDARTWLLSLSSAEVNTEEFALAVRSLVMAADGKMPVDDVTRALLAVPRHAPPCRSITTPSGDDFQTILN